MYKRRLVSHIYPALIAVTVVAVSLVAWYAQRALRHFHYQDTKRELGAAATLLADRLASLPDDGDAGSVDFLCRKLGRLSGYRFTVILPRGTVTGDSVRDPAGMDDHSDRPEILAALKGPRGTSRRFSDTLRRETLYVAVPVVRNGETVAIARASLSLDTIDHTLAGMRGRMLLVGAAVLLAAVMVGGFMARGIRVSLAEARRHAERLGRGELDQRIPPSNILEVDALAGALNDMADQLRARIRTITEQRDEQDALLAGMVEGVVAVDTEGRILRINASASRLFRVEPAGAQGRPLLDVIRNTELHALVDRAFASEQNVEGMVFLHDDERHLQVHGARLVSPDGSVLGVLVVLNDITWLRRLETMRRDFVANVSHELKTPITSIKGFADTLLEQRELGTEERTRFLRIIARQSNRLQAIVEDLLALSSIEHETENGRIDMHRGSVRRVLESAVQSCRAAGEARKIEICPVCREDLQADINTAFLEQALINLIDNAVKYSPPGKPVIVTAERDGDDIALRVKDEGPGIPAAHLPRIFERFYRVDKGRSRQLGGTGLGLAIVKHIANAHRGRVEVQSKLGEGSTFSIHFPAAAEQPA